MKKFSEELSLTEQVMRHCLSETTEYEYNAITKSYEPYKVPACTYPVTHRFKMPTEPTWGYRCDLHASYLQAPGLLIERI
jgi:hypothetical protein